MTDGNQTDDEANDGPRDDPNGDSTFDRDGDGAFVSADEPPGDAEDSHVDPDVPSEKRTGSESGKVLTPEELDITDSEYVEELDDSGRYVVSPGGRTPNVVQSDEPTKSREESSRPDRRASTDAESPDAPNPAGDSDSDSDSIPNGGIQRSPEAARTLLAEELARTRARYGIDIVARFDGKSVRHRTVSNDVVGTFENLVHWYARHVTDDTPVDEVLAILLEEADVGPDTESMPNLAELLETHDLDETDSISELVDAIRSESGDGR